MREKALVTKEEFETAVSELIQRWFYLQADLLTLQVALIEAGLMSVGQLEKAREQVLLELKSVVESLGETNADRLLRVLRGFEGPPQ